MGLGDLLQNLDPTAKTAIELVVIVALLDFVLGTIRAIADRTFAFAAVDVWVRTKLLGRVLPIVITLLVGSVVGDVKLGDFSFNVITIAAMTAAVTFVLAEAQSIVDNVNRSEPHPIPTE
jgi:hypothetical protein